MAEQLICNQQVIGSTPFAGFRSLLAEPLRASPGRPYALHSISIGFQASGRTGIWKRTSNRAFHLEKGERVMKKRLLVVVLSSLLVLALILPVAAMAAGTDRYTAYGSAIRQTYGHSIGQTISHAPASYGVRLGHYRFNTSQSYGVRLGHYSILTPETYGSRLRNRTANPSVIPYIPGSIDPATTAL